jgi:predicted nucleic acid-binding protein
MTIAVLDACVLYPPTLRDVLMWLAVNDAYSPRWTQQIHDEWMRNVLKDNPQIIASQLDRTRRLMDILTPGSLVVNYKRHMSSVNLPDPDDRHVLAAAIESGASHIVTLNLTDFPAGALQPYGIRAVTPDDFLCALFDDTPNVVLQGLREHRAALKNPAKNAEEYIAALRASGLRELARRVVLASSGI